MPVTLKDIATELNISTNAVSRALRNMPDIGPETTKLVHETAQRLGYRKNLAASYLKTAKSMMFGIIVPDICNPVFSYMYKGIEKICSETNYTLMLGNSNENPAEENAMTENMVAHGVDGIFIVPCKKSTSGYPRLDSAKIPYVILQRKIASSHVNFVQSNDYEGGYFAAQHLYQSGHRDFLLVFTAMSISSSQDRYNGFVSYLKEQGLSTDHVTLLECDGTKSDGYTVTDRWLRKQRESDQPKATAIFCFSDYIAYGVYSALTEHHLKIPEDISVVGYDNNEYSNIIYPALTTVDLLPYEIGMHSAKLMMELIGGRATPTEGKNAKTVISPKLIVRNSTK